MTSWPNSNPGAACLAPRGASGPGTVDPYCPERGPEIRPGRLARGGPLERLRAKAHNGYNVSVIKEGMDLLGLAPGRIREPASKLDKTDRQELVRILRSWGKLDEGPDTDQQDGHELSSAASSGP